MKPILGLLVVAAGLGAYALTNPSMGVASSLGLKEDAPSKTITLAPTKWGKEHKVAKFETATFAGGCFWGTEQGFRTTPGVIATAVGYSGGHVKYPTYHQVCSGTTGHAESTRITFDPKTISYEQVVEKFFTMINPAELNRQGPDYGTNYRSAVFYADASQKAIAEKIINRINTVGKFAGRVVTKLEPAAPFYMAEDYHQQYDEKHGVESCPKPDED